MVILYSGFFGLVQAVQAMVQQAMQYIDQTPDLETKIELIKTLNNVSAGKVSFFLKKNKKNRTLQLAFFFLTEEL